MEVASKSSAQHSVSPCFLAPGIYSLYAYDVHQLLDSSALQSQREATASAASVTAISPAYFIIE